MSMAQSLLALVAEIRQAATRRGDEPLMPPPPEALLAWAARLEDIAAQVEREEAHS